MGSKALPVVLGAFGGITASLLIGTLRSRATPPAVAPPAEQRALSSIASNEPGQFQAGAAIGNLNSRLAALEARSEEKGGASPRSAATPPNRPSREEQQAREAAEFTRKSQDHASEPVDKAWAPRASETFEKSLKKIGDDGGFQVSSIDCRYDSCTAKVDWPTYESAQKTIGKIVAADIPVNCRSYAYVPQPADPALPYSSVVIFDNCIK